MLPEVRRFLDIGGRVTRDLDGWACSRAYGGLLRAGYVRGGLDT